MLLMSFLSADETVFNMNNNSWLTHIGANNLMSSSLHEFSASNNDELIETNNYSYRRPSAVHYVESLIILLMMTLHNFRAYHVHIARDCCILIR